MAEKKKLKDTKFGKVLLEKIPSAAAIVGDILPDIGALGIVKNIISRADITEADKEELLQAHKDYELEVMRIEAQDRTSARLRQVEFKKAGGKDIMMTVTGCVGLMAFMAIVYAAIFLEIKNQELFHLIAGNVTGAALGIFAFYYGSSKGSKEKTEALAKKI